MSITSIGVPYSDVGLADFEQLDIWLQTWLLGGNLPRLISYPFTIEENQTLVLGQVVGLNARDRIVPATVTSETTTSFVSDAGVVAGGTGGTNGAQVVTGTTGAGMKFQANVTIAGGVITAVNSMAVEGAYSAPPANAAVEPVTGAGLTGATLSLTVESVTTTVEGVQATGVMTQNLTTAVGQDDVTAPVWYSGNFSLRGLTWDASFGAAGTTDNLKLSAFQGAPTPTQITVTQRQSDL
jgi:hypothetical protein